GMAVVRGLEGFEGRCSLTTWILSILIRRARTITAHDARRRGISLSFEAPELDGATGEWEPGRGKQGLWEGRPVPWGLQDPAAIFQSREALQVLQQALQALPDAQRRVVLLRDVEDVSASEICNMLAISETNQRVLLHRGRSHIRRALDAYLRWERPSPVATATTIAGTE